MALTRLQAKQFIARALGAEGNTTQLAAAQDALFAAIEEWNLRKDWRFMLMDTADGFAVAACSNTAGAVTTTTTDGFAGVNVGQTFTVTDGLPAGTYTVATIVSTSSITVTGGGGDFATEGLTFSGDIPITSASDTYNLPAPFKRPYTCRIVSGNERTLDWMDQLVIDKMFQNQQMTQTPAFYNLFNKSSFTQTRQSGKIRFFPFPGESETARVRYFRPIAQPGADGTFLDLPDRYTYALLELGRWHYLKNHDSETDRMTQTYEKAKEMYQFCAADDEGESIDRDVALIAQVDHASSHQIITDEVAGWP